MTAGRALRPRLERLPLDFPAEERQAHAHGVHGDGVVSNGLVHVRVQLIYLVVRRVQVGQRNHLPNHLAQPGVSCGLEGEMRCAGMQRAGLFLQHERHAEARRQGKWHLPEGLRSALGRVGAPCARASRT